MRTKIVLTRLLGVCAIVALVAFGANVSAVKGKDCPPKPKFCPLVYAPVICDDGKVYPNECWAAKRCATGCEPYGEWPILDANASVCPPKPKVCPKLWAPVICDNGKVYANECWAAKRCATGCVPYDWL